MKSTLPFFIAVLSLLFLQGCKDESVLFSENQKLSADYTWKKSDKKTFVIDVKENAHPLELAISYRCATGYSYDKVLLRITEISPDNEKVMRDMDFIVRDEKGEFLGEKGYDIIDIEQVMDANKKYPAHGKYTYIIEQTMPGVDTLNFAMEVGMSLRDKAAKK